MNEVLQHQLYSLFGSYSLTPDGQLSNSDWRFHVSRICENIGGGGGGGGGRRGRCAKVYQPHFWVISILSMVGKPYVEVGVALKGTL